MESVLALTPLRLPVTPGFVFLETNRFPPSTGINCSISRRGVFPYPPPVFIFTFASSLATARVRGW